MRFLKNYFFISIFFICSCSGIEFQYSNDTNLHNPIYNKTLVTFDGLEIPSLYRYSALYFGNKDGNNYVLNINIEEEKTKRAVQTNQAISKLDYELSFKYNLFDSKKSCNVYSKNIMSRFSFEPKSSGYNFGSDESLQRLYELSTKNNMEQFVNFIKDSKITKCLDED
tara:strand:+ start:1049 stop:1552 length:504 start_codon:yes stop_codon:yes gene_type:complete